MDTLQELVKSLSQRTFYPILWKGKNSIESYSSFDLQQKITQTASGLQTLGLQKKDRVAIISNNHPEWFSAVLGINYNGLIDVSRSADASDEEIQYILEHSESKVVFVENESQAKRVQQLYNPKHIITLEPSNEMNLLELEEHGQNNGFCFSPVSKDDIASILYTSGTSGQPKGTLLTHGNYMANACALHRFLGDISNDTFIHHLPNSHVFGRQELLLGLVGGSNTFYSDVRTLKRDAKKISPSIIVSVPRLWESVYEKLTEKAVVKFASAIPNQYLRKKIVGSAVNDALGGNVRLIVSGGGGLPHNIDAFFNKVGIEIIEGYGLTETSPVISARPPGSKQETLGTVGSPLDNVEVSIRDKDGLDVPQGEEGIIHVRGPNVMKEYYKDEKATNNVIGQDKYFNTGDMGYFNSKGYLVVSGRTDDRITLSNGENINPNVIEQYIISNNKYISHALVVGGEWDPLRKKITPWKKLGALVVPHYDSLTKKFRDIHSKVSDGELINHPDVVSFLEQEVRSMFSSKKGFRSFEQVYGIMPIREFSIGNELTSTLKVRRDHIIKSIYPDKISALGDYLR